MAENIDKNIGPLSSKNENTGFNRRKALKKILAATPLVAGFPLSIRAWGQPVTYSDQPFSSVPITNMGSTPSEKNVELEFTAAPTSAPTEFCGTLANTYIGGLGGSWNQGTNWSLGIIPTKCHQVIIPAGKVALVPAGQAAICFTLEVEGELTVPITATLTVMEED